jgi:deazaflavin-dependent oxidoreductase (nitroreductase family)
MAETRPPQVPAFAKAMMRFQAFLLRRNWMGKMGEEIMVINVTGRKSGKKYATPIGYLSDGDTIVALTNGQNPSNWYRNAVGAPDVMLEIKGQAVRAKAEPVTDPAERQRIFTLYRRERTTNFTRLFGIPAESSESELQKALETRRFVRFEPIA